MIRRSLCALAVLAFAAVPMSAGVVNVVSMTASQYDYPYFGAMVYATGTSPLGDIHLTVTSPDGSVRVVEPDSVEVNNLDGAGFYLLYKVSRRELKVVKPGDVLTAVVRDKDANDGSKSAGCVATGSKKSSSASATCK